MKIMKVELFKSTGKITRTIIGGFFVFLLSSCSGFETHPYDVNIKGEKDINAKNMAIIEKEFANKEELRIAFISDTHLLGIDVCLPLDVHIVGMCLETATRREQKDEESPDYRSGASSCRFK